VGNEKERLLGIMLIIENPNRFKKKAIFRMTIFLIVAVTLLLYLAFNSRQSLSSHLLWVLSGFWLSGAFFELNTVFSISFLANYLNKEKIEGRLNELNWNGEMYKPPTKIISTLLKVIAGATVVYFVLYCIDHGFPI
jgi:MFS-type transporter involved in bile tolerance (Atg22 family)